jgi:hypothetical protein
VPRILRFQICRHISGTGKMRQKRKKHKKPTLKKQRKEESSGNNHNNQAHFSVIFNRSMYG